MLGRRMVGMEHRPTHHKLSNHGEEKMKTLRFLPRFACLAFPLLSGLAQAAESGSTIPLPDKDRLEIEK